MLTPYSHIAPNRRCSRCAAWAGNLCADEVRTVCVYPRLSLENLDVPRRGRRPKPLVAQPRAGSRRVRSMTTVARVRTPASHHRFCCVLRRTRVSVAAAHSKAPTRSPKEVSNCKTFARGARACELVRGVPEHGDRESNGAFDLAFGCNRACATALMHTCARKPSMLSTTPMFSKCVRRVTCVCGRGVEATSDSAHDRSSAALAICT